MINSVFSHCAWSKVNPEEMRGIIPRLVSVCLKKKTSSDDLASPSGDYPSKPRLVSGRSWDPKIRQDPGRC